MIKTLPLNSSVDSEFRKLLAESIGFGKLTAERIEGGEFWVWVSDALTSIDVMRLREDIFYPTRFDVEPARQKFIEEFLDSAADAVVIADTFYDLSDPKPPWINSLPWFSFVEASTPSHEVRLCAFLQKNIYSREAYEQMLGAASPYPTALTLTHCRSGRLHSGADLTNDDSLREELLDLTSHALVGVFDETSMMGWTKR